MPDKEQLKLEIMELVQRKNQFKNFRAYKSLKS